MKHVFGLILNPVRCWMILFPLITWAPCNHSHRLPWNHVTRAFFARGCSWSSPPQWRDVLQQRWGTLFHGFPAELKSGEWTSPNLIPTHPLLPHPLISPALLSPGMTHNGVLENGGRVLWKQLAPACSREGRDLCVEDSLSTWTQRALSGL